MDEFSKIFNLSHLDGESLKNFVIVIGYILSTAAISIHIFVHFTTDIFRNFPGNLLLSNCVLLFFQYCFSTTFLILKAENFRNVFSKEWLKNYDYYITAYIWSVLTRVQFSMAYDLWKCLRIQTINVRLSTQHMVKFIKYSVCCWLSPFIEWSLLWCFYEYTHKYYKNCWLCYDNAFHFTFMMYYMVDFIFMALNIFLYLCCLFYIYRTKSKVKNASRHKYNFLFYFKICGRLFIMSEVNYTLLILFNHFNYTILKFVFQIFMAFHGTIVFATIVLKKTCLKFKSVKTDTEHTATINITT